MKYKYVILSILSILGLLSVIILLYIILFGNINYSNNSIYEKQHNKIDSHIIFHRQFTNKQDFTIVFPDKTGYAFQCENSNKLYSKFRSTENEIPLIYRSCKHIFSNKFAPLVIWLHGGPFTSSQSQTSPEQDLFLQNGYIIAEVQYIGSAERPWLNSIPVVSSKSFLDTKREIIELGRFYKNFGRKIVYAGDSFGGKIISSMLDEMDQSDNVVMFSPYLQSVKSDPRFSDAEIAKPSEKWLFQIMCRLTAVTECDDPDAWLEKNIFRSYYEFTPIENFRGLTLKPKIYIVSGADDKRVGVEPAKAFAAAFRTSTKHLIIANLGHESPKNIEQFEEIERFLAPVLSLGSKQ